MTETAANWREGRERDELLEAVAKVDPRVHRLCVKMEEDLSALVTLFTRLSSILDERSFGKERYSQETLVSMILNNGPEPAIMLPTKVIVGRSLLVCKFNFVGFLVKVCAEFSTLSGFKTKLQDEWESVMFLLLLEELYYVLLERRDRYSQALRRQAAIELIHLWEYRSDNMVAEYANTITDLWMARRRVVPVFGTMMGSVELMRMSTLLSSKWHGFLSKQSDDLEVVQALEEFIFALTHKDIHRARKAMREKKLFVIDREMLCALLGSGHPIKITNDRDPRAFYRFFKLRAKATAGRELAGIPGPTRTLEELLLVHFLTETQEEAIANKTPWRLLHPLPE